MLLKRVALHTLLGIVLLLVVLLAASCKGSEERLEILTEDALLHLEEHISTYGRDYFWSRILPQELQSG